MPTFGNDTTSQTGTSAENNIKGSKFKITEDGVPESITSRNYVSTTDRNWKCAIYDSDKNLVCLTEELLRDGNTSVQWIEYDISGSAPTLTSGSEYYLCSWSSYVFAGVSYQMLDVTGGSYYSDNETYGDWPDPSDLSVLPNSYTCTIYCTYNEAPVGNGDEKSNILSGDGQMSTVGQGNMSFVNI